MLITTAVARTCKVSINISDRMLLNLLPNCFVPQWRTSPEPVSLAQTVARTTIATTLIFNISVHM